MMRSGTGQEHSAQRRDSSQEREEDERTVIAVFRSSEAKGFYRVYFADATYLEIAGSESRCEHGDPPDADEADEDEILWERTTWHSLPWSVRETVRHTTEEAMRPYGEELAGSLLSHPYEEQFRRIAEDPEFHEWSLAHALLAESRALALADPRLSVERARVALYLTRFFSGYNNARVAELRARILAHLGNALRILGEIHSAAEAFRDAELCLDESGSLDGNIVRAEILSLKASLLREERRFDEAFRMLEDARELYEAEGAAYPAGRILLKQSKTLEEQGELEEALTLLRRAEPLLDPKDVRLKLCLRHNLVDYLAKLGRFGEAGNLLPEVHALAERLGNTLDLVRLRWVEARILCGLGMSDEGERLLCEVRSAFEERDMAIDAALVSLDLALLYVERSDTEALRRLSEGVVFVFSSRSIRREAIAALLLFVEASRGERLTASLVRELARYLEGERRLPSPEACASLE